MTKNKKKPWVRGEKAQWCSASWRRRRRWRVTWFWTRKWCIWFGQQHTTLFCDLFITNQIYRFLISHIWNMCVQCIWVIRGEKRSVGTLACTVFKKYPGGVGCVCVYTPLRSTLTQPHLKYSDIRLIIGILLMFLIARENKRTWLVTIEYHDISLCL